MSSWITEGTARPMTTPNYSPTAVVWLTVDGQYEYDAFTDLSRARRRLDRYKDMAKEREIRDFWVRPTVLMREAQPGQVLLDPRGDLFRVTRVDTWEDPGSRTVHGQVWGCGRRTGWCAGAGHQIIGPSMSVFPVMPDPDSKNPVFVTGVSSPPLRA